MQQLCNNYHINRCFPNPMYVYVMYLTNLIPNDIVININCGVCVARYKHLILSLHKYIVIYFNILLHVRILQNWGGYFGVISTTHVIHLYFMYAAGIYVRVHICDECNFCAV